MPVTKVEKLFGVIDKSSTLLQAELSIPYLEAIIETGENIFHHDIRQNVSELTKKKLSDLYASFHLSVYNNEEIRKSMQLAILKGMNEAIQPHHAMTPDSVSLFINYLIEKLMVDRKSIKMLDPVVGTGNLLMTVMNNLNATIDATGVEVDETLLKLTYVNANLMKHELQLFHRDALQPLMIDFVDLVIADLPVGYYPNDEVAKEFLLKRDEGQSFIHYLLIEQSLRYTKPGGFLIFLIPKWLFEQIEANSLTKFIKEHAFIYSLLELPESMFKSEVNQKSILVLQKYSEHITRPKQVLIASLPSFSNQNKLSEVIKEIDEWFLRMNEE